MTSTPPSERSESVSTRQISRGATAMLTGQLGRFALQFLGTIVLARILDPSDYGLLALVLVMIGFGEVVRDFGLSLAVIQSATLERRERDNLFWANAGIGLFFTLVAIAGASVFADIFDEPRLQQIIYVLAWTFTLNGLAAQYRAGLNRSLKYGRLALVDTIGQGVGLAVGIVLALAGAGFWALAAQQLAQAAVALVVAMVFGRWLPGRYSRDVSIQRFVQFGWPLVVTQLIGFASRNTDSVIIGHKFGPGPLGLYNRAFQLLMLPLNQINAPSTQVALPVLARVQDDRPAFARYIVRGQAVMSLFVCILFVFLGLHADALVEFLFGAKWAGSAPLFAILAIAGCFQAVAYATYWAFLALAATRSNLKFSLISRSVVIAMVIGGSVWGVKGVALGYTLGLAVTWPLGLLWINRFLGCPGRAMFLVGARSLLVAVIVGAPTLLVELLLPELPPLATLALSGVLLVVAIGLLAFVWPRFREDARSATSFVRSAAGRRAKGAAA